MQQDSTRNHSFTGPHTHEAAGVAERLAVYLCPKHENGYNGQTEFSATFPGSSQESSS